MPIPSRGYRTYIGPPKKEPVTRIKMPKIVGRPARFRLSSLIDKDISKKDAWWLTVHRRGVRRELIGIEPLEMRATPHDQVKGTLPERIIYKYVVDVMRFVQGFDFSFQSSEEGGRLEMGGLVVDFLFPFLKVAINPLGPQHGTWMQEKKDEEQLSILVHMGYAVYMMPQEDIYNEQVFETQMRRIFNLEHTGAGNVITEPTDWQLTLVYQRIQDLRKLVI